MGDSKLWWLPVQWAELQDTLSSLAGERNWPVAPRQPLGPAPADTTLTNMSLWMPMLGPGPRVALSGLRNPPADHSSLPPSQRIYVLPLAMGN
eukprot:703315-Pelagomonas_calceolata.AAC.4